MYALYSVLVSTKVPELGIDRKFFDQKLGNYCSNNYVLTTHARQPSLDNQQTKMKNSVKWLPMINKGTQKFTVVDYRPPKTTTESN